MNKLLKALVEGQVKLAQGQRRTDDAVTRLAHEVSRLRGEVSRMGHRLDRFAQAVVRGFTDSTARDKALDARVDALEKLVAVLGRSGR